MNLRPYQSLNKILLSQSIDAGHYAIIDCMPTGAGKTVCFADLTRDCLNAGWPVLIMCNRRELIDQAKKKLNACNLFPTLIVPGYKDKYSNLYLASVDTLRNRRLPDVRVIIIDEAHLKNFDPFALEYKKRGAIVLGFTATPIRQGKSFLPEFPDYTGQLGDIYTDLIMPTQTKDLLEEGFLVPAIHYGPQVEISVKRDKDDYNTKALFDLFNKPKLYDGVIDNYLKFAKNEQALVFNINVEHSQKMTAAFQMRGITSEHVDGATPLPIRKKIFNDFAQGHIQVLNNCAVATTGYDEPSITTIIINRATASLSLFLQMCGRGSRLHDGKDHFKIIDQGGNIWRHGLWHQEREWSLDTKRVSRTLGAAPIKMCQICEAIIPASASTCSFCQAEQIKKEKETNLLQAEFDVIDSENVPKNLKKPIAKMSITEIEQYRSLKGYKIEWAANQLYNRDPAALWAYAKIMGYSDAWVRRHLHISEKKRIEIKDKIWQHLTENLHLTESEIIDYSRKKLHSCHSNQQIDFLIPKIIEACAKIKI